MPNFLHQGRSTNVLSRALVATVLFPLTLFPDGGWAQSPLSPILEQKIAAIENQVISWRRDIHQHPELGNREFRTAKLVADHLRSLGIEVRTQVAHTGVVGILRGGRSGPVVALRADMDALPIVEQTDVPFASHERAMDNGEEVGVMHACGHDTHVAILMGVATVLASIREEIPGTIKFIFQPAEEGVPAGEESGAELMVREGVLTDPDVDAAFALHIESKKEVGHIFYRPGGLWASVDDFRLVVRGRQTHAGYPWDGVDPIVVSAQIITALQTIVSRQMNILGNASVVTVGTIRGGVRNNVISEEVEMTGTIRALSPSDRLDLRERVRSIATHVAEGMGATVELELPIPGAIPVTYNDVSLTSLLAPVLQDLVGPKRVHLVDSETAGEDFAFFSEQVPSFYIQIGGRSPAITEAEAPNHHAPDFFVDELGLLTGVRAMAAMTLHYLETSGG